jgi:hypothetical protein
MKRVIVPVMLGFGVTLALVIGQRMTTDAMAVVLGVAVGVAASVPTSILLVALVRRAQRETGGRLEPAAAAQAAYAVPPQQQPNIIVLNPGDLLGQRNGQAAYLPQPPVELLQAAGLRRLRVVGDEDEWA